MITPDHYLIASKLFTQLLGAIYFFAFGAFLFQIRGLIGAGGILPVKDYLDWIRLRLGRSAYYKLPTLFWFNSSDAALMAVTAAGTLLSLLLLFNFYPLLMLILLYLLYFSILSVGQDFLSFGWELFLMEITLNAILLNMTASPNPLVWISLNLLLFRFHFQGGIVKLLSRDPNWRNLTAIAYHYQTQPIPNATAWYVHKLPLWFHKASTMIMFIIELLVPFFIFFPLDEVRLGVFICFVGLQAMIYLTGNFSYLNHLTLVFSILLVSDRYLTPIFGTPLTPPPTPFLLEWLVTLLATPLLFLQIICLWNQLFPHQSLYVHLLRRAQSYFLVCRYGIFAVMTTKRYEIGKID
jgi:lipase maturation factor 1